MWVKINSGVEKALSELPQGFFKLPVPPTLILDSNLPSLGAKLEPFES